MAAQQELDRFEIRFSGLGGQGIITLGKIMGQGLAIGHGYNVTQTQSYGPEARGGSSRCDLVISSNPISYPKAESLDLLVALSQEACNTYYPYLKPGGILVIESDLVKQPPTNIFLGLPYSSLAKDKVGIAQAMNTVVLGSLSLLLPYVNQGTMRKSLEAVLPPKIKAINTKAFNLGYRLAKKNWGADAGSVWDDK
jgi:2-oxoglutarate ferredoxin oxidoreductase subunit gamma